MWHLCALFSFDLFPLKARMGKEQKITKCFSLSSYLWIDELLALPIHNTHSTFFNFYKHWISTHIQHPASSTIGYISSCALLIVVRLQWKVERKEFIDSKWKSETVSDQTNYPKINIALPIYTNTTINVINRWRF